jgi:hypothetical protein
MERIEMNNEINWQGKGWYAGHQVGQYESQRVETVSIPWTEKLGSRDYDEASSCARSAGLGTPVWAEKEGDLE